ncbi:autophagy-related 10 isoform X2 [Dermacentor variabilis]|uniref:autophagy-related 10 isoform X2 n=1 Tax=Dermacentor variabilis TaxID=34621 RepID=UPI003F5C4271
MLEWDEFLRCCKEIEAVSATLDDGWRCVVDKEGELGFTYLEKRCTSLHKTSGQRASWSGELLGEEAEQCLEEPAPDPGCADVDDREEQVLQFVYHVVYSASYGVPVMYFNVWRRDGSLLPLSDVWSLMPECLQEQLKQLRWSTVTQQKAQQLPGDVAQLGSSRGWPGVSCPVLRHRDTGVLVTSYIQLHSVLLAPRKRSFSVLSIMRCY